MTFTIPMVWVGFILGVVFMIVVLIFVAVTSKKKK